MVNLQRWRRPSDAGEGENPVEDTAVDPVVDDPTDDLTDETVDETVEAPELTADGDADAVPHELAAARAGSYGGGGFSLREWTPLLLLQAIHPKQAILTALCVAGVAVLTGRSPEEVGIVALTVLVGQAMLGLHNDVVDRRRDQDHNIPGKPVADGRLDPGTVWYALVAAFWLLLPLAVTTGFTAACIYMGSVAVGMLGNVLGRTGFFSWWSWALSFGMLPAYLSYGGWGGQAKGDPPEVSIVVLAALLGIGIHFTRSVWGLVADHAEGWTYLPLKLGLKLGATRLLVLSSLYTAVIVILLAVFGARDGLSR